MVYSDKADKGTIVYVGGLLETIKKEAIEAEFEKFGKLTRVWVAFNPPGFAFVEFENKEDAETAVNAMHNANILGSKLRVEISRGRPRGRGGMSRGGGMTRGGRGMDRGGFRGGRGDFRGGRGDFRGGRGGDFGRGRGLPRGRGGFGGRPFDREPFGGEDRYDDFDRRKPEYPEREFGPPREFGARRELGAGRDYDDIGTRRGFGAGPDAPARDYPPRDIGGRDYPPRGIGGRDYPPRDMDREYPPRDIGGRDFPPRDMGGRGYPPRDAPERDYGRDGRDFGARDFGGDREMNGVRSYGAPRDLPPVDRAYPAGRDLGVSQATLGARDYPPRDIPPVRDVEAARDYAARGAAPQRDYGGTRDIGLRRDAVRDFEPPRDMATPRDFAGRPGRVEYPAGDRFGGGRGGYGNGDMRRPGAGPGGRFAGREVGGTDDYGGYGARDRFRSRSPIGRGGSRPPMY